MLVSYTVTDSAAHLRPLSGDMPDIPQMFAHLSDDVHDISRRLARLESFIDEFEPVARQYTAVARLSLWGKKNTNGRP